MTSFNTVTNNIATPPSSLATEARIKKLPPLLINQLAAGEIVTRPASVVKELMENAIDAGASEIEVKITQGGMGKIEVSDNGHGIHPDDMVMAVTRHATSKVADVAQLHGIQTLGFRGEALASTAAVSRLTLISCHDETGIGRQLTVVGVIDDEPQIAPVLHAQGTTVIVKDLYFNVPARRGNLKSIATEFAHIESVVRELALAVSHMTVRLWHDDRQRFCFEAVQGNLDISLDLSLATTGQSSMSQQAYKQADLLQSGYIQQILARLSSIFPRQFREKSSSSSSIVPLHIELAGLLENIASCDTDSVSETTKFVGIRGLFLPQIHHDCGEMPKLIYINGRLVKDTHIAQQMRESVTKSGLLSTTSKVADNKTHIDNYGYVLFFALPNRWINVNVHPSKQRIAIQALPNVLAHLDVMITAQLKYWYEQWQQQRTQQLTANVTNISSSSKIDKPQNSWQAQVNESRQHYHLEKMRENKDIKNRNDDNYNSADKDSNSHTSVSVSINNSLNDAKDIHSAVLAIPRCLQLLLPQQYSQLTQVSGLFQSAQGSSIVNLQDLQEFLMRYTKYDEPEQRFSWFYEIEQISDTQMALSIERINQYLQEIFIDVYLNHNLNNKDTEDKEIKGLSNKKSRNNKVSINKSSIHDSNEKNIFVYWQDFITQHAVANINQSQLIALLLANDNSIN
ncbi:DNA mismatch repair endonuclease MutL [Psychrobacter sp. I-STPA10]|uniref:DNA mismatch repair endonuclease MutL n=1 Tax=Psychrobacter sp. I-STPA10 TaxID=2585769 RepID=UPI001E5FA8DA|nr:DNA mismatch repair endonuclease MutL [Psychrobacter sp. I-STPA10]